MEAITGFSHKMGIKLVMMRELLTSAGLSLLVAGASAANLRLAVTSFLGCFLTHLIIY